MKPHANYFDCILVPPRFNKICCAVSSYAGQLCINFTRKIRVSYVEREFFSFLVRISKSRALCTPCFY